MAKATHAYIGVNQQGQARAIVCDDAGYEKDTAKLVAEWITMGRTVERLPIEEAKARLNPEPSEVAIRKMRAVNGTVRAIIGRERTGAWR